MSEWLSQWVINTMSSMGYLGIGLLMFLENLFPPIPSEVIMPFAGFTVSQGKMEFVPAVAAGVVGTVLGALPWYYAGRFVGETRLRELADRYGKWLTISGKDIDQANSWFTRHEGKAVFLCRLVPGVRTLISLPAGIAKMPMIPFLLYSTAGTTLWVAFLTFLGYKLGEHYDKVDEWLGPLSKYIIIGLAIAFGLWIWKRRRSRSHRRRKFH